MQKLLALFFASTLTFGWVACSSDDSSGGSGGHSGDAGNCTPKTCAAEQRTCGSLDDGCGSTLDCGSCAAPATCGGNGKAGVCGCVPTTCAAAGKNCGKMPDGCGDVIECGSCNGTQTCGGGDPGQANVCGEGPCTTSTTCEAESKNCGTISDGCGDVLECGTCSAPDVCGGNGVANVCACQPTTCGAEGKDCGTIPDGCGGTLDCGTCGSGGGGGTGGGSGGSGGSGATTTGTWSGILAPERAIDWTTAGTAVTHRTTICATLNPGATAAQINSAIASCPSGQVVFLNAGSYNIGSPGIIFDDKSDVTLRGAGADKTLLKFSAGNDCSGQGGDVCVVNGQPNWTGDPGNVATWSAGYSKGTTEITLSNTTNLKVGTVLILDQENDSNSDNGSVWVCGTGGANVCADEAQSGAGRPGSPWRQQQQLVRVKAITGNKITLEDPIYMPNWRASQKPEAWWSNDTPVTGVGIEDLSLDHTNTSGVESGVYFYNAYGSWMRGVRSIVGPRNHVWLYQSLHVVIRDSYFYGTKAAESESYGVEHFMASSNLIENNIFDHIAAPMLSVGGSGSVFAYNYSVDDFYDADGWAQAAWYHHGPGNSFYLWEGNEGFGLIADDVHGTAHFITAFRNRAYGVEPTKTMQTVPIHIYTFNRYFNVVGNVLGTNSYHTKYSSEAPSGSSNCDKSIYSLGWGGNCGPGSVPNDTKVISSLLRWGNFDTVNDASRFEASEVPSGDANFPNALPASNTLPASFFRGGKPSFFGSTPWPPIGPDVTGGADSTVAGHAHELPAHACYKSSPKSGAILGFNATTCYGAP